MATSHKFDLDSFRGEILALIAPHTAPTDNKPPFTLAQLIVMGFAMTSDNNNPQPAEVAMMWILKNFQYYASIAYKHFFQAIAPSLKIAECTIKLRAASWEVPSEYEVPLVEWIRLPCISNCPHTKSGLHGNETGLRLAAPRCRGDPLWSLDFPSARIFLGLHVSNSSSAKPFRLLDLPTELRERIVELALNLPGRAVVIARDYCGVLRPFVFTRNFDQPVDTTIWDLDFPEARKLPLGGVEAPRNYMLQGPSLSQHLAILQTSKQIHNEALPVFYRNHTFVFQPYEGFASFLAFMRRTSMRRLNHIRHLAIMQSNLTWIDCPAVSVQLLKAMENLRELDLYVNEDAWDLAAPTDKAKKKRLLHLPCVQVMRSMRGLSRVTLHGPCPILKPILEKEMCLPKADSDRRVPRKSLSKRQGRAGCASEP